MYAQEYFSYLCNPAARMHCMKKQGDLRMRVSPGVAFDTGGEGKKSKRTGCRSDSACAARRASHEQQIYHGPASQEDPRHRYEARQGQRRHSGDAMADTAAVGKDAADSHEQAAAELLDQYGGPRSSPGEFAQAPGTDEGAKRHAQKQKNAPIAALPGNDREDQRARGT